MPEEEDITDNISRLVESASGRSSDELDPENLLMDDLGFSRQTLLDLAFTINGDEFFKPLGVGLIPDDVAECETLGDLIELVITELNNEMPPRRKRPPDKKPPGKK